MALLFFDQRSQQGTSSATDADQRGNLQDAHGDPWAAARRRREELAAALSAQFVAEFFAPYSAMSTTMRRPSSTTIGLVAEDGYRNHEAAALCFPDDRDEFEQVVAGATASGRPAVPRAVHWDLVRCVGGTREDEVFNTPSRPLNFLGSPHNSKSVAAAAEGGVVTPSRRVLYGFSPPPSASKRLDQNSHASPQRRLAALFDEDRSIAKMCVRCVLFSSCVPTSEFKHRLGFAFVDAKRMYESMLVSDAWVPPRDSSLATPVEMLVHNSFNEVLRGSCKDWARWLGSTSRRRVEEAFERVTRHKDAIGKVISRNTKGQFVTLAVTDTRRSLAGPTTFFADM